MQITHQADYAIRAMHFLSTLAPDQRVATNQIAEAYQIPPSFLTKIIAQLSVAGLIRTSRGARGGVTLARPPEQISVLEVLEAIDGPISLNDCVEDPSLCQYSDTCTVHGFWTDLRDELVDRLRGTTFDKLANQAPVLSLS